MKVITGGRNTGKTTELVEMALSLTVPSIIVVPTAQQVIHILEIIQDKNPNNSLIHVITVSQLINNRSLNGFSPNTPVFFNEAISCLRVLCRNRGSVKAVVFSEQ